MGFITHANGIPKSYKIKSVKAYENKLARNRAYYETHKEDLLLQMKIQKYCKMNDLNRSEFEKLVSVHGYEATKLMFKSNFKKINLTV